MNWFRLKLSRRLEVILMGILFALVPALVVGVITYLVSSWQIALIVGGGVFGLGLDINFGKGCR
jgi:predicted tellurium resistance membrane protein TerC